MGVFAPKIGCKMSPNTLLIQSPFQTSNLSCFLLACERRNLGLQEKTPL